MLVPSENCAQSERMIVLLFHEHQPRIEFLDCTSTLRLEQSEDVCDEGPAITKFDIMHDIDGHQRRWIEIKFGGVSVLWERGTPSVTDSRAKMRGNRTLVGTHEPTFNGSYSPL